MGQLRKRRAGAPRRSGGFSIIELLMSIVVVLILTAIAVPSLMRSYQLYQLNDAATRLSGMLKLTRFEAIRKNTPISCQIQQNGSNWLIWVDSNANGVVDANETQYLMAGSVTLSPAGSPPSTTPIATAVGAASLSQISGSNTSVQFDQRGAVRVASGQPRVYILYIGNAADATLGYRAVVLLPSGVVHVWTSPGTGWQQVS